MNSGKSQEFVKSNYFNQAKPRLTRLAGKLFSDVSTILKDTETIFDGMLPNLAYVEMPTHPLAPALFVCSVNLSLYLALKKYGINPHLFGSTMLFGLAAAPVNKPNESDQERQESLAKFISEAKNSQIENSEKGRDVFEIVAGDNAEFEWGYNIKSCAICYVAQKYNAMDLVPYMCAVDDVMSDKFLQGLRRTGSIAVGASQCDFRFKQGGNPLKLADQYPNQIRIGYGALLN
ncbi:MAG: L-2-amino-thiazoline-4-carboxylic acid hydrolase [Candidatus Riflebacteria bacterium]|nr:L-2-amino-thiazoline-4-carboxylic acid hydrolase [Candidatus Riflebacteria bacterium]